MTKKQTTTATTTRHLFIDGRPFPTTQSLAHADYRFARHGDGRRMSATELRAHLAANGVPAALRSKSWKCDIGGSHVLQVKVVK